MPPGGSAEVVAFDVTDAQATKAALDAILAQGAIQILVNNAGIHDDAVFPAMRAEQWHRVIDVSLHGFFNVTQPLTMPMIRGRWGRIVNVSSVAAIAGNRGQVNYSAAKGALNAATKSLSIELASRGITVNAVAPGIIETTMIEGTFEAEIVERMVPMKRVGQPAEVAELSPSSPPTARPTSPVRSSRSTAECSDLACLPGAVHQTELLLYFTLLQLAIIVLAGRLGSTVAVRIGQTAAVGEIIVGILLGPSFFGLVAPELFHYAFRSSPPEPLQMLSQLGLILLMFQIGLEFDFSHLNEQAQPHRRDPSGRREPGAALRAGARVRRTCPRRCCRRSPIWWDRRCSSATAFSITALPILGRILIDFGMTRAPLGVIAISAAAINDVIGWMMLALVTALTVANFDAGTFGVKVGPRARRSCCCAGSSSGRC